MSQNAIESLVQEIAEVFAPMRHLNSGQRITTFFKDLGYELPGGTLFQDLPQLVQKVEALLTAVEQLAAANTDEQKGQAVVKLLQAIGEAAAEISDSVEAIKTTLAGIPNFLDNSEIDQLGRRLLDYLLSFYLWTRRRNAYGVLLFVGVLDEIEQQADAAKFQPEFKLRKVYWERLPKYFTKPQDLPEILYKWDTGFEHDRFLNNLYILLSGLRLPGGLYTQSENVRNALGNTSADLKELRMPLFENAALPDVHSQFGIDVSSVEQQGAKKPGFALIPYVFGAASFDFDVHEKFEIIFEINASIDAGIGLIFRPGVVTPITNLFNAPLDSLDFGADMTLRQKENTGEIILVGDAGSTRLALEGPGAQIFVKRYDELDVGIETSLKAIRLVVSGGDGDGFLAKILGDKGITAEAGFGLGYSRKGGVYFKGSGALEIQLATHLELGPLEVQTLTIALKFKAGDFVLEAGAGLKLELGPLVAVVENMGIAATLSFPESGGNLGSADLDFKFKPPNGVGLAINAGPIRGGGYLYFDFDKEEYAGALELTFSDFLSLKAIGLITTRMPDGSKGFSLLIIITAEFTIQLGYGFVFLGAGGLLGLNRTMRLEVLAMGARTGGLANIMFPTNVVANATRIISDLRKFFPVEEDKFLVGPMVKLGWGTPTLISISLGIIIEIRTKNGGGIERIAIVGVLRCILPDEAAAVLVLQVAFIGAIDFEKKNAFFFASIFESRVLFITIEGEMGVLVAWGDNANFLISVGGFHPRFTPPPLPFPVPKRVALNILNESWGKIRVEGYFAVTTNTVQLGVKAELFFGFSSFGIEGFFAFDALFQFDPFFFIIEISGKVGLQVFGFSLFTISLKFSLEGPTPWRAKGYGKLKILFFSFKARFDVTWGEQRNTTLEPIAVMPVLESELSKTQNWQALLPNNTSLLVSLRELPTPAEGAAASLALHPVGTLRVSQRAVPLDFKLDKVGNQKPSDANRFTLKATGDLSEKGDYKEDFARAQFQDMADSKKLSSPAFEKENGGLELSATGKQIESGRMTVRHVRYELVTIDTAFKRRRLQFTTWLQVLFGHFLKNNAAAQVEISQRNLMQRKPRAETISVRAGGYTVATNHNNAAFSSETVDFSSQAQADAFMAGEIAKNHALADSLHVIPNYEVNSAP